MAKNQTSLFDDYEGTKLSESTNMVKSFNVKVKPDDDPGLRRLKHNFNHRLKAIAKLREEVEKLPKIFAGLNKKYNQIVKPTEERLLASKLVLVEAIDKTFAKKSFSDRERDYMRSFMIEELNSIAEMDYEYDSKFEKYFEMDDLMESEESVDIMQQIINSMMGFDVDIDDIMGKEKLSPEDFEKKYGEEMNEKAEPFQEEQKAGKQKKKVGTKSGDEPDFNLHFMKTYKNLAKKIHPDLEQNANIRNEKEKLMQELTHAKDNQDLFQLIAIKLKIEKIENNEAVLDEAYLKLYAQRLLEQKKALELDIFIMKKQSGMNSWLYQNFHSMHEKSTLKRFEKYMDELEVEVRDYEQLAQSIKTVKGMKQHIKAMRATEQEEMFYGFF